VQRPSSFLNRRSDIEIEMTPMIDVVFQLMIFFVWTSGVHIVEHMLPSRVSEQANATAVSAADASPPPEADFHEVVVRILWRDGQPHWQINEDALPTLTAVRNRLTDLFALVPAAPLVIHPDEATPLEHVIAVYDLTRLVGFERVQLAVSADE